MIYTQRPTRLPRPGLGAHAAPNQHVARINSIYKQFDPRSLHGLGDTAPATSGFDLSTITSKLTGEAFAVGGVSVKWWYLLAGGAAAFLFLGSGGRR